MKNRLIAAEYFNHLTDKYTNILNLAELSVFVQYIDSDTYDIKEKFLGMTKIVGNKEAEALSNKISITFIQKGMPLSNIQFNSMSSTNTMRNVRSAAEI